MSGLFNSALHMFIFGHFYIPRSFPWKIDLWRNRHTCCDSASYSEYNEALVMSGRSKVSVSGSLRLVKLEEDRVVIGCLEGEKGEARAAAATEDEA